jgi:predicted ATP-dependent endonuclease of OLD family
MPFKLEEIYIDNYKSFHKTTVKLDDFNVFVGANNAGKTNFVDMLEFIQDAIRFGLVTAVKKKGGFEKIKNFRNPEDFVEIKAVFKRSEHTVSRRSFPELFLYFARLWDEYEIAFRFTGRKRYSSEIRIRSNAKIKKLSEKELQSLWPELEVETLVPSHSRLKGELESKTEISLSKEVEEIDEPVIPNGFDKKGEKTGYQEKYKTVSRNSGILDDIKFDEGVLDETVAIDIDIKKRDKGDIDRRYYISLLDRFFDIMHSRRSTPGRKLTSFY